MGWVSFIADFYRYTNYTFSNFIDKFSSSSLHTIDFEIVWKMEQKKMKCWDFVAILSTGCFKSLKFFLVENI